MLPQSRVPSLLPFFLFLRPYLLWQVRDNHQCFLRVPLGITPGHRAAVTGASLKIPEESPLIQGELLGKLRISCIDFVEIDQSWLGSAYEIFQHALYGKFLGKAPCWS